MHVRRAFGILALALSGCSGIDGTVRDRMAADTGCPSDSIQVTRMPGSAYRAIGCEKAATYVCGTPQGVITCTREGPPEPLVPLVREN